MKTKESMNIYTSKKDEKLKLTSNLIPHSASNLS